MSCLSKRARVSVAITLTAAAAALAGASAITLEAARRADLALASAHARYARVMQLQAADGGVEAALAEVASDLARHAYPAAVDPRRAGTDLQRRLRASAEQAGVAMSASRILPLERGTEMDEVRVSVTLEGSLEQFQAMLLLVAGGTPTVTTSSLILQPARSDGGDREHLVMRASFGAARLTR